jgi:hypothetical protein
MIEFKDGIPGDYTGLANNIYGMIFLYFQGKRVLRPGATLGECWWWYPKKTKNRYATFDFETVFPKVWAIFKDEPVLGPILAAYALGNE